jgi:hypothetical protein
VTRNRALLFSILALSGALRVWIAHRGGQGFWPDEGRYLTSLDAVGQARQGHADAAFREVFSHAGHVFFVVLALLPAALQSFGMPNWMAAAFLGLFSVGSIYLIGRISWITSGDEGEALLSTAVAACSASLLYFARHLFPYDAALFFGLLGLYVGLGAAGTRGWVLSGAWISIGFLTYNGYWVFCGLVLTGVAFYRARSIKGVCIRVPAVALGFAIPIIIIMFAERAAGVPFFHSLIGFAGTVTEGDYGEGWTFVRDYLWKAEHGLLTVWVLFAIAACGVGAAGHRPYLLWWAAALGLGFLILGEMSAGIHRFVIYGRIARSLVPFFALLTGGMLASIGRAPRWGRWAQGLALAAMLVQAAFNFRPIVTQSFPPQFRAAASARSRAVPASEQGHLRVLNAHFFHQAVFATLTVKHHTLLSAPHPLQYEPYEYEGYRPDQRKEFEAHDITMRLVYLDDDALHLKGMPDPLLGGFLGPVRLTVLLPSKAGIFGEPLVVTGKSEQGDFVYVLCVPDERTLRVGFDHWGYGGPVSEPIVVDYGKPHTFEVSMGSLMPPLGSDVYRSQPGWTALARRLQVRLDGRDILNESAVFYPAEAFDVSLASNLIGGSTADPDFAGVVESMEPMDPQAFLSPRPPSPQ